jgi:hypothetical protein
VPVATGITRPDALLIWQDLGAIPHHARNLLLPLLQDKLALHLQWSSPLLRRLLDSPHLPSDQDAAQLLLLKKELVGYACPSQVLDCIKAAPRRREALLRYVDFSAMTPEELKAVQQYAAAMCAAARAGTASAASSRRQSRISGSGADVPSGPADQFWPAVLVECGMYLAQAQPLEPADPHGAAAGAGHSCVALAQHTHALSDVLAVCASALDCQAASPASAVGLSSIRVCGLQHA